MKAAALFVLLSIFSFICAYGAPENIIKIDDCSATPHLITYKDYVKIRISSAFVHCGWKKFYLHPAIRKDFKMEKENDNIIRVQSTAIDGSYSQMREIKMEPGNIVYVDFQLKRNDQPTDGVYSLVPLELPLELLTGAKVNGKEIKSEKELKEFSRLQEIVIENLGFRIKMSATAGGPWLNIRKLEGYAIGRIYGTLKPGEEIHLGVKIEFSGDVEKPVAAEAATPQQKPEELPQAYTAQEDQFLVIPKPQEMTLKKGKFILTLDTEILLGEKMTEKDAWAAEYLQKELKEIYKLSVALKKEKDAGPGGKYIIIGEPWKNSKAEGELKKLSLSVSPQEPGPEGYILAVTPENVVVSGSDERGTYWGVQTLLQLLRTNNKMTYLPEVMIRDFPVLQIRGAEFFSTPPLPVKSLETLVDKVFVKYKINTLIFALDGWFNFPSHPEITPQGLKKEELEKILEICQKHHIRVIPEIDCLRGNLYRNCTALREDPSDKIANGCPSNPETYKLLYDLFRDVENIWKPYDGFQYFSIGCDEVVQGPFGDCRKCKATGKNPPELFANAICKLKDYWKEKGIEIIVFHDSLVTAGTARLTPARAMLPKDTVISYWGYRGGAPVSECMADNFPLIGCWQFCSSNIWRFANQMKEYKQGKGIYGLHTSIMPDLLKHALKYPNSASWTYLEIYAGDCAWNPGKRPPEKIPYNMYQEYLDRLRDKPNQDIGQIKEKGFAVDLTPYLNTRLPDILGDLPREQTRLNGILFNIKDKGIALWGPMLGALPQKVIIPVNKKAKTLLFLHGCLKDIKDDYKGYSSWKENVGQYRIWLSDDIGSKTDLVTCENIQAFGATAEREVKDDGTVAWQGKEGKLYMYRWENPAPDKKIERIEFISNNTKAGPMLLALTGISSGKESGQSPAPQKQEEGNADPSLVLYYDFNSAAGNLVKDRSPNEYTGEWTETPLWASGVRGGAAEFDGTNNFIIVRGEKLAFTDKKSFTVNLWVKPEKQQNGRHRIFITGGRDWNKGTFSMSDNGFNIRQVSDSSPRLSPGVWQMATFVYDSEKHSVSSYLNAKPILSKEVSSFAPAAEPGKMILGKGEGAFKGLVDEFRIYDRALSSEEIQKLYDTTRESGN